MSWILQGNPKRFDIDDYLVRYPYLYWSAPINQKEFSMGDQIFIWRSGEYAGVVAIGRLEELPVKRSEVRMPSALGEDLWVSEPAESFEIKVGIKIDDVRLTKDEGMVERVDLKGDPTLRNNKIITNPQGTVFRLTQEEATALLSLWGKPESVPSFDKTYSASEGSPQLTIHYRRERSRDLIKKKKSVFKQQHGTLYCEICTFSFNDTYPKELGEDFIEAHHLIPLSKIDGTTKTTLDDLILVCSNCHRMIHRTMDCDTNFQVLIDHFSNMQ